MPTLSQTLDRQIRDLRKEFEQTLLLKTSVNTVLLPCESIPVVPGATQTSDGTVLVWERWSDKTTPCVMVSLFYKATAIPNLIPILEYLEAAYSEEFTSHDRPDGVRVFSLNNREFNFDLYLYVSPDSDNPEATCRKVLVGEDTQTNITKTPRYAIDCSGEPA